MLPIHLAVQVNASWEHQEERPVTQFLESAQCLFSLHGQHEVPGDGGPRVYGQGYDLSTRHRAKGC